MRDIMAATAAILLAATAHAQQTAPLRSGDVVVTGRRPGADAATAARRAVRSVSVRTGGQVARFDDPICPQVYGLPDPSAGDLAALVTRHARAAGAPVAGRGCRANLQVLITPDGGAVLRGLYRARPDRFGALAPDERRRLLAEPGPARVITGTALLSRDGDRPGATRNSAVPAFNDVPVLEVRSASILNPPTRQDITGVVVLLDADAVEGKTLGQLAGYVAMRALARTRGAAAATDAVEGGSILTLFDAADGAPRGLTRFDAAYLRALYKGPATRGASTKLGDITRAVNRD